MCTGTRINFLDGVVLDLVAFFLLEFVPLTIFFNNFEVFLDCMVDPVFLDEDFALFDIYYTANLRRW